MPPAGLVLSLSNGRIGAHRAVDRRVRRGDVAAGRGGGMPHVAAGHPDLGQNARGDEVLPGLTADRLDQLARDQIQHVVVGVRRAKAGGRLDESQPPRDLLAVVGGFRPPQQIAGAEAETAAVHQQVAHRDLARDERIPHRERRQIADHRRVPFELALLDQQAERRRRERLGVRRDPEQRARVHRRRVSELAHAVSLCHARRASSLTIASASPGTSNVRIARATH